MARRRNQQDEAELQKSETWDWEKGGIKEGNPASGAVVSVRFPGEDFDVVSEAAERTQVKLSQFIREAAVEKARGPRMRGRIIWTTASGGFLASTYAGGPIPTAENAGWTLTARGEKAANAQEEFAATR